MKLLDFLLSYPCGTIYVFWLAENEKGLSSLRGDKSTRFYSTYQYNSYSKEKEMLLLVLIS